MAFDETPLGRLRGIILGSRITQGFGCTSFNGEPLNTGRNGGAQFGYSCPANKPYFHWGIDLHLPNLAGKSLPEVRSPSNGTVEFAGCYGGNCNAGYGNQVRIRDARGYLWILGHFASTPIVHTGDRIEVGTVVGSMGSSGASTGPHLHIEVRDSTGKPIDPAWTKYGPVMGDSVKVEDIYYGLAHVFGFGAGPNETNPPAPGTGITGGEGTPPYTGGSRYCGPRPAPFQSDADKKRYDDCIAAGGVNGSDPNGNPFALLDPATWLPNVVGTVVSDWGPNIVVGFLGVAFFMAGLKMLGKEKPVQVVTAPIRDVASGVGSVAGAAVTGGATVAAKTAGAAKAAKQP